ncbi:MFS transporter [Agromyces rhizosphaerae]|uniref:MFS transporter n=1 Tax=Agromyces rhizosphaerae TaxID=88374 RepID=A0A9W6FRZ8_9MICO|nr:MFS transporter [Agromyces rhizosphaerae]GLI28202.1 MFS transporter [Agromyces rhizosphaerae]
MPKPDGPNARTDQPEGLWRATMRYVPVGLALFAVQLDFFALNLALPTIAKDLGVPVTDLQWMLSGYLLSLGSCFVPAGKLGDTIGRRRVLIIGMIVFGGTSLVCALASAAPVLIAFRVLQGIGSALIMPNAFALIAATARPEQRARIMGIMLGLSGSGTALGPVIGGGLASVAGWRWVFLINVPVAIVSAIAAARLPESTAEGHTSVRSMDWLGVVLVTAGLALACVGIDNTTNLGIESVLTWAPAAIGAVLLVWFFRHVARREHPLINLRLFRERGFVFVLLAGTALNIAFIIFVFAATLQLQDVRGLSPAESGFVFMLAAVGVAACGPTAGFLTDRFGAGWVLSAACVLATAAVTGIALAQNLVVYTIALAFCGLSCGMGFSVSQIGAADILPAKLAGEGSALALTSMIALGGVGTVIAGAVIEALSGTPKAWSLTALLLGLAVLLALTAVATIASTLRRQGFSATAPAR